MPLRVALEPVKRERVVPGEAAFVATIANAVPLTARPGRYGVRFRYRDAQSDWVEFAIR